MKQEAPIPRAEVLSFTVEESKAIIKAVKTRLGPGFTISHLVNAAVVIALLDTFPSEKMTDEEAFVGPTTVNLRRYIKEELKKDYIGLMVSSAFIRINKLKSLAVSSEQSKEAVVEALSKASKDVKTSLDTWLEPATQMPSPLAMYGMGDALLME